MTNYICENAQIVKNGINESIKCKKDGGLCCFVRYCPTKRCIENTEQARLCKNNPKREEI